ncbi:hypothetical protein [Plantactinospora sp. WMMB782]
MVIVLNSWRRCGRGEPFRPPPCHRAERALRDGRARFVPTARHHPGLVPS